MTGWRTGAIVAGVMVAVAGLFLWRAGAGPMVLVFGVLLAVTAALEPIYGGADEKPQGTNWHATDERFIDPQSGKLVSVWFDPATGERRYVDDGNAGRPPTA